MPSEDAIGDGCPDLRTTLRNLLAFEVPEAPVVAVLERVQLDGYTRCRIEYPSADGDMIPAFLLTPDDASARGCGVVVHHQHNAQWHLGKSEVAGLAGDPRQAFGQNSRDAG